MNLGAPGLGDADQDRQRADMKEHQAPSSGCLKNITYGNFSNVDRSHRFEKTNTYSFIGTLPGPLNQLRSRRHMQTSWMGCAACGMPAPSASMRGSASIPSKSCCAPIRWPWTTS